VDYQAEGCDVVNSIDAALKLAANADEIMVIGGSSLFEQMFDTVDKLYLTRVHAELEGDTWFPEWDQTQWQLISQESHPADEKNDYAYSFEVYQRV
jgi:dihydrofolate reductase